MEGFQATDVILIAVIIGLVEAAKWSGLPKRFAPGLSLVLGVVGGIVYIFPGDVAMGVLIGLVMGLSASGMYSGTKATLEK